jgi:ADP-ribosylglycohydrolase
MRLSDDATPKERALLSLAGLSVGDALGERFFGPPGQTLSRIEDRWLPPAPWRYTDDTEMALSVVQTLLEHDRIDPDVLAGHFAERYDGTRGYGGGAHGLLRAFQTGVSWEDAAPAMFGGSGSFGNGAAMRVAPLGGYLADRPLEEVAEQARLSSIVTHAHPEGIAGGVAVAVAAAAAWNRCDASGLFEAALAHTPAGETRAAIERAAQLAADLRPELAAGELGSGQRVSAQDTVPFVLWCAAHVLAGTFEEAFWRTVRGLGDRDTTCAMVGGIVALSCREVPDNWIAAREPLPGGFALST